MILVGKAVGGNEETFFPGKSIRKLGHSLDYVGSNIVI